MKTVILLAALCATLTAWAAENTLQISNPWSRSTAPGSTVAGVFLEIANTGKKDDAILGVTTPMATKVELHEMYTVHSVMKMHPVSSIVIPAQGKVQLAPGGLHIMLWGLKQPLKESDQIPLTLTFEKSPPQQIRATVKALNAGMGAGHAH